MKCHVKRKSGQQRPRYKPLKHGGAYRALWRLVDGAVLDAFRHHPEYLTPAGHRSARYSVVKRVVGNVMSFAVQTAKGRSGP